VLKKCFSILLFIFFLSITIQTHSQTSLKFTLTEQSTQFKKLTERSDIKVIIFYSPDCPICQSYVVKLNSLCNTYQANGFSFFSAFPGTLYSDQEIGAFYKKYKFKPEQINDPKKILANKLKATVTPQVFVIAENGTVLYSGAIDDQYVDIGKKRSAVSKNYLKDVLNAIVSKKTLPFTNTYPIGCIIE
jgi:thiol-disulfide isomerase/thioredoxin